MKDVHVVVSCKEYIAVHPLLNTLKVYQDIATLSYHDHVNNVLQLKVAPLAGEISVTEGGVVSGVYAIVILIWSTETVVLPPAVVFLKAENATPKFALLISVYAHHVIPQRSEALP